MKRLNPYAVHTPANAQHSAPYARFVSCGYSATLAGACFALAVLAATHSACWMAAAVFLSLELNYLQAGIIAWLTETMSWRDDSAPMDHHKVAMPEPRHQSRHRTATAAGFTIPQVLYGIAMIIGAHALFAACVFIIHTVFGMAEPRW